MKIIAEIGSNVKSLEDCIHSIKMAKHFGADAVKFQYFTSEDLYGFDGQCKQIIDKEYIPSLRTYADTVGVEFMCTAFNPKVLKWLLPFIKTIKIASSDMEYIELLDIALESGKDIYLSTGAHTSEEIKHIVDYIGDVSKVTLFYCQAEYPTYRTDFRKIFMRPLLNFPRIGLSDHSKEIYLTALTAKMNSMVAIEKHVNFCGYTDTPDAPHSLSTEEFGMMVSAIRGEKPIGFLSKGDDSMRLRHNRRLVVTAPIAKGETFKYKENYGVFRSLVDNLDGLNPIYYDKINQTEADKDYQIGDVIKKR